MAFLHIFRGLRCETCEYAAEFYLHWGTLLRRPSRREPPHEWEDDPSHFIGHFTCKTCQAPTAIEMRFKPSVAKWLPPHDRTEFLRRIGIVTNANAAPRMTIASVRTAPQAVDLNDVCEVVRGWPATVLAIPRDLPADIERMWSDELGGKPSARAIALFGRSLLEQMLKARGAKGKDLKARIDDLADSGVITRDVASWAHEIRDLGNEGAHELNPVEPAHAAEVHDLITMIAELLFTYPARVARLRARRGRGED